MSSDAPGTARQESRFETLQVHAGQTASPGERACAVPVYQTTSFAFTSAEHGARLFALAEEGHLYSRISNPTVAVLERRLAALEGGTAALVTASGQAALLVAVATLCEAGDNLIASPALYGGSTTLLGTTLARLGVETRFVAGEAEAFAARIDGRTRALFVETLPNPSFAIPDLDGLGAVARAAGVPLVVDNTFGCGGYLCRPLELGADLVVASATKWIGGHGVALGGVIVEGGRFAWTNGRFPRFTEPSAYPGVRFAEAFPSTAFTARARLELARDLGPCPSPFNAFLLLLGLETLSLRVERQCVNAQALARFLAAHPGVAWVRYPGLPGDPAHARAQRYLRRGFGGVLTFGVRGGLAAGRALIDSLELATHLANVGDARTLVIHPASTTHAQLDAAAQAAAGVPPDLVRVSLGIEHIDDITADFERALARAGRCV